VIRNHQFLIAKQSRKYARTHHWKPLIVKELTLVQVIVWYITVELLRTKQLPPSLTYSRMHMVPSLKSDIEKQASRVYSTLYRHDDNINKFMFADTNDDDLDGKVGVILYYDASTSCYQAKLCQSTDASVENIPVLTENMEPHRKIRTSTYVPDACKESCQVSIQNHFPFFRDTTPSVVFRSDVFRSIGGLTRRPNRGGNGAVERLIKLIEEREAKENEELEKVRLQSVELKKISRACIPRASQWNRDPERRFAIDAKCQKIPSWFKFVPSGKRRFNTTCRNEFQIILRIVNAGRKIISSPTLSLHQTIHCTRAPMACLNLVS